MVNRIISEFLGPFVVILEYTRTRTGLITILFSSYLIMYVLGTYQLKLIKRRTERLIDAKYAEWDRTQKGISPKKFMELFMPLWTDELKNTRALFILNKHDLWPVRITPENVLKKIPLSSEYIRDYIADKTTLKESGTDTTRDGD